MLPQRGYLMPPQRGYCCGPTSSDGGAPELSKYPIYLQPHFFIGKPCAHLTDDLYDLLPLYPDLDLSGRMYA